MDDVIYKTTKAKYNALVQDVKESYEKGQPVLVGTVSIDKSEILSSLLKREKIPHQVLNAKFHEKEAEIIAQAGKYKAVTIATNMAGRGTDIMLGGNLDYLVKEELLQKGYSSEVIEMAVTPITYDNEEVKKAKEEIKEIEKRLIPVIEEDRSKVVQAGGLKIIGSERHESRRIDNQLRGRSGRQGDPGFSQFCVSFEDDLMVRFGTDRAKGLLQKVGFDGDLSIRNGMLSNSIESAQKRVEGNNFDIRKTLLEYDDVINQQRMIIYERRNDILDKESVHDNILDTFKDFVAELVDTHVMPEGTLTEQDNQEILEFANEQLFKKKVDIKELDGKDSEEVILFLYDRLVSEYEEKIKEVPEEIRN